MIGGINEQLLVYLFLQGIIWLLFEASVCPGNPDEMNKIYISYASTSISLCLGGAWRRRPATNKNQAEIFLRGFFDAAAGGIWC
jgi:hypothetical protein